MSDEDIRLVRRLIAINDFNIENNMLSSFFRQKQEFTKKTCVVRKSEETVIEAEVQSHTFTYPDARPVLRLRLGVAVLPKLADHSHKYRSSLFIVEKKTKQKTS